MDGIMHKIRFLVIVWGIGISLLMGEYVYYKLSCSMSDSWRGKKESFSTLVGLPDSALVSEAHYVRHRSLGTPFAFFNESPSLLEYFPSTFIYHYAPHASMIPSRIEHAR